jgi:hypothetical protein
MKVNDVLTGFISWNGYFYGVRKNKINQKYYKSKNVRFDDTCGDTEECTDEEYLSAANKYMKVMK